MIIASVLLLIVLLFRYEIVAKAWKPTKDKHDEKKASPARPVEAFCIYYE